MVRTVRALYILVAGGEKEKHRNRREKDVFCNISGKHVAASRLENYRYCRNGRMEC